jgi:hypothetical protein
MSEKMNLPATSSSPARDSGAAFREAEQKNLPLRANRTINELLVAEMFLVQATIESVSNLGESLEHAREALDDGRDLGDVLKAASREVFEPYRERYNYFRRFRDSA